MAKKYKVRAAKAMAKVVIGMPLDLAEDMISSIGCIWRVREGYEQFYYDTYDLHADRINLRVADGKVVHSEVG